jgi:hypothetical protein
VEQESAARTPIAVSARSSPARAWIGYARPRSSSARRASANGPRRPQCGRWLAASNAGIPLDAALTHAGHLRRRRHHYENPRRACAEYMVPAASG